jgi:DNA helicase-2/ATP-dependent DNA helicase PcrA
MNIVADLHIHSPYSRAVSRRISPPGLDRWARIKGIGLLGTGDCTHPQWLAELKEKLAESEEGLYVLKDEFRRDFDRANAFSDDLPYPREDGSGSTVRFVFTGEISTIYSRDGKARKVHHLILLPNPEAAAAFQAKLEGTGGNIRSDGRPILGLDSRDLLELLLETDPRSMLIPAHIWTPWFSALGGRSGFDSINECYRDLASHIGAIETGLSSNPPMNWALSVLDRFAIISNSDAHSPDKLGREATVFDMELSYPGLRAALAGGDFRSGAGILKTIEFFPQEGKYHYDGHRTCGVCFSPEEMRAAAGICPVCGKPLTAGVLSRVMQLADRPVTEDAFPPDIQAGNKRPYHSLIPLKELLAELLDSGGGSKKVAQAYMALIKTGGSELSILMEKSLEELERLAVPGIPGPLLAAAIDRMRRGEVSISAG